MVDPPSGWQYGFPRMYDAEQDGKIEDWLVRMGYPVQDVEFALKYLKMWYQE